MEGLIGNRRWRRFGDLFPCLGLQSLRSAFAAWDPCAYTPREYNRIGGEDIKAPPPAAFREYGPTQAFRKLNHSFRWANFPITANRRP